MQFAVLRSINENYWNDLCLFMAFFFKSYQTSNRRKLLVFFPSMNVINLK